MPPNPPNKAHGFAMCSMSRKIAKSEKKILAPNSNPGYTLSVFLFLQ